MLVIGGAIWAYKFTSAPASLLARINDRQPPTNSGGVAVAAATEFLDSLGKLIGQSKQILAVHNRGATPYIEIVLWREDRINPGVIDPAEVVVIAHSQVMRTISVYSTAPEATNDPSEKSRSSLPTARTHRVLPPGQMVTSRSQSLLETPLTPDLLTQPSFCDRWRSSPQVRSQVIASGISDLSVQAVRSTSQEPGATDPGTVLRLTLRWASDSADVLPEQTVLVPVHARPAP